MTVERPNGEASEDEQVVANPEADDQTAPGEGEQVTITAEEVGELKPVTAEESPGPEDVALEENGAASTEDSTEAETEAEKEDEVAEEPEEEQPEIEVETAPTSVDEIDQECRVCHKTIPAFEEFIVAAYGPVHTEPCSHEGKSVWSETSPLEATD